MKKISLFLMAFGLMVTSCTKDDFDYSYVNNIKEKFSDTFILTYGEIAPNHDWGFSSKTSNRAAMRGTDDDKWTDTHSCNWEGKLTFTKPADAIDVTQPNFDKSGSVYYVPEGFSGELDLQWLGLNSGAEFYNYGTVTAINNVNYNGIITIYNAGTLTNFGPTSGGRHTVINTGSLTVCGYANIGDLYNSGTLVLEREHNPWWPNEGAKLGTVDHDISIYSAGEDAIIMMPDGGGHFDAYLDVHNKIYVDGDIEFQNADQSRYVCELEVTGELYLNKGPLYTASIVADKIKFNCFSLYLREEAHVIAGHIDMDPAGSYVYGHTNSFALIEAESFYFKNKNDLTHNFSNNIYFNVSDYIEMDGCFINNDGNYHKYNMPDDLEQLLANTADEYNLVAGRLNNTVGEAVTGKPECGTGYTIYVPKDEEDPGDEEEPGDEEDPGDEEEPDEPTTWTVTGDEKMIIAEDLAAGNVRADFDYNDVVFKAYIVNDNGTCTAYITLLAAGGELPLYVGHHEVHAEFGVDQNVMVNTKSTVGKHEDKSSVSFTYVFEDRTDYDQDTDLVAMLNDIPVWVYEGTPQAYELITVRGQAPEKICVDPGYKWTKERTPIQTVYPDFQKYVNTANPEKWWEKKNENSDVISGIE